MTINHRIDAETKTLADNMGPMELATLHEAVRQAEKHADMHAASCRWMTPRSCGAWRPAQQTC